MSFGMIMLNQNMVKMQACCMDPDSFIIHIKRYHIYKNISNFKLFQRHFKLWTRKATTKREELGSWPYNERCIRWKNHLKEFVELRAKIYNYLIDDGSVDKKAKGTK